MLIPGDQLWLNVCSTSSTLESPSCALFHWVTEHTNVLCTIRVSGELDFIVEEMECFRGGVDELYLSSADVESQGLGCKQSRSHRATVLSHSENVFDIDLFC